MRISDSNFLAGPKLISLILLALLLLGTCRSSYPAANDRFPAAVIGVHHFGPDYWVNRFYIDQYINDNIGEGGGGGSIACCVTLPRQWHPSLSVDVRWKVHHIVRSTNPRVPDKAELEGIYQAQVPVEEYVKPGDLFVHFFPNGRVRVLVSGVASNDDSHPIRQGHITTIKKAIVGKPVKALFTDQESARRLKMFEDERKKYGDWR